jgi:hypothetical protein
MRFFKHVRSRQPALGGSVEDGSTSRFIAPKRTSGLKSLSEGWVQVGHLLNKGNASFDDIVDLSKDCLRHGQAERFRGFQIDQQLELIWLLDG